MKRHPAPVRERTIGVDATVRVGPLMSIPHLVRELGGEPEAIFASAGFRLSQFEDPDTEISYAAASQLIASCVAATGCRHFGLLLGRRASPASLGLTGFLLQAAPDVRTALRNLLRHLDLHDQGGSATLVTDGHVTYLGYAIHQSGVEAADQIYDLSMATICGIMRDLCGDSWRPTSVLLSRKPPYDKKFYSSCFRAPLRFQADRNAVAFATRWLDHPLPAANPLLHRYLEKEANERHIDRGQGMVGKLRRLLRASLATGDCAAGTIARQLGMHERTLNRRLREEGTTFRQELNSIRYELARQWLSDHRVPLCEVAAALDYADATALSRAFKRWAGMTPTEWRTRRTAPK